MSIQEAYKLLKVLILIVFLDMIVGTIMKYNCFGPSGMSLIGLDRRHKRLL